MTILRIARVLSPSAHDSTCKVRWSFLHVSSGDGSLDLRPFLASYPTCETDSIAGVYIDSRHYSTLPAASASVVPLNEIEGFLAREKMVTPREWKRMAERKVETA